MGLIPVGRVLATQGLKGEVKFKYYNDASDEFYRYASVIGHRGDREVELKVVSARFGKGLFYLALDTIESVDDAAFLINQELAVREEDLPVPEDDEYYEYQLIGLKVVNEKKERMGEVQGVLHTGAHDILVVAGTKELLVPMVDDFIVKIDVSGSLVEIREDRLLA